MSQVKDVSIVLDTYPQTKAIKEGTLSNPGIHLNFTEYKPIRKAFDDMLKDLRFDLRNSFSYVFTGVRCWKSSKTASCSYGRRIPSWKSLV